MMNSEYFSTRKKYLQLIFSFDWRFFQSHLLLLGASWHKDETMWPDMCLIIPEFVLVLVRARTAWTAHTMHPVTSIMSLNGGSSWPRGDWSWDSWLVGLPGAGARCFSYVRVCTPHYILPSSSTLCLTLAWKHKGRFEAAPTDPAPGPCSLCFWLTGKHGIHSSCRSRLRGTGQGPSSLCLSTYGGLIPSVLCSHAAPSDCHSYVYTDARKFTGGSSAKKPIGKSGSDIIFEVIHL